MVAVRTVTLRLRARNSKAAMIFQLMHSPPVVCRRNQETALNTLSNTSSMWITELALGSGTVVVRVTAIDSTIRPAVGKPVKLQSVRTCARCRRSVDRVLATTERTTTIPRPIRVHSLSTAAAWVTIIASPPPKSVKACVLLIQILVSPKFVIIIGLSY